MSNQNHNPNSNDWSHSDERDNYVTANFKKDGVSQTLSLFTLSEDLFNRLESDVERERTQHWDREK